MTDIPGKMHSLNEIMTSVHALAERAWPDGTPQDVLGLIIDIQQQACKALGLPEDLDLMAGID